MTHRILIADDDPSITLLLPLVLDWAVVDTASDGLEALTMLQADPTAYDAVVLDVMMPVMTGPQVLAWLRANDATAHLPVMVLTARNDRDIEVESFKNGGDAFMAKPFDPDMLSVNVRQLVATPLPDRQVERLERLLALTA